MTINAKPYHQALSLKSNSCFGFCEKLSNGFISESTYFRFRLIFFNRQQFRKRRNESRTQKQAFLGASTANEAKSKTSSGSTTTAKKIGVCIAFCTVNLRVYCINMCQKSIFDVGRRKLFKFCSGTIRR